MTPRDHVARANALADAATDPRDIAAYRAVAEAWARIAAPPIRWSLEPARRQLAQLQADCRQPLPAPIEAPSVQSTEQRQIERTVRAPVATITF